VLPKNKSRNITDIKTNDLTKLMLIVQKIAQAQKIAFKADGIKIQHNCEEAGGQVIFHTHVHIIPFYKEENENLMAKTDAGQQAEILKKYLKN
jgi:histidine triad (HIT) family protein